MATDCWYKLFFYSLINFMLPPQHISNLWFIWEFETVPGAFMQSDNKLWCHPTMKHTRVYHWRYQAYLDSQEFFHVKSKHGRQMVVVFRKRVFISRPIKEETEHGALIWRTRCLFNGKCEERSLWIGSLSEIFSLLTLFCHLVILRERRGVEA